MPSVGPRAMARRLLRCSSAQTAHLSHSRPRIWARRMDVDVDVDVDATLDVPSFLSSSLASSLPPPSSLQMRMWMWTKQHLFSKPGRCPSVKRQAVLSDLDHDLAMAVGPAHLALSVLGEDFLSKSTMHVDTKADDNEDVDVDVSA